MVITFICLTPGYIAAQVLTLSYEGQGRKLSSYEVIIVIRFKWGSVVVDRARERVKVGLYTVTVV